MKPVAIGNHDGRRDDGGLPAGSPVSPMVRYTTAKEAVQGVGHVIEMMDSLRKDLAHLYVFAASGTVIEHEVGEALTAVRKSLVRLRKARDEMSDYEQPELPLQ